MKVCVIGLGTVGTPTLRYIHEKGLQVFGYDVVERSIEGIKTYTNWKLVPNPEVYVITVPSESVEAACKMVSERDKNRLVSVESTVPAGTCRRIFELYDLRTLVHCPHRYWAEEPLAHGVKQQRVIGAVNKQSLEKGLEFYRVLDIPVHVCPTIEIAEMCKVAENAYRFVQIAFAEELRRICEEKNISFGEVKQPATRNGTQRFLRQEMASSVPACPKTCAT
jgi:UDP-N-acetyl-D-mannosaminuronate dehydrogenase